MHIDEIMDSRESALEQAEVLIRCELEKALCGNNPALHLGPPLDMVELQDRLKFASREIQHRSVDYIICHPLGDTTIDTELRYTLPKVLKALNEQIVGYGRDTMNLSTGGYVAIQ